MLFGIVMGLCASASWAAANVFIQRSSRAVGPFRAVVWAQIVGGLALAPFALVLDHRSGMFDARAAGWGLVAGLSSVLAYACLFFSMERGRLTVVVPVMSSWSVVAAALSLGILGETVRRVHLLGAGLIVAGVLVVSRFSQAALPVPARAAAPDGARRERGALLAAVGAAVGFGVLIPGDRSLGSGRGSAGRDSGRLLAGPRVGHSVGAGRARRSAAAAARRVGGGRGGWTVRDSRLRLDLARGAHAPVAIVSPLAGLASAFTVLFAWLVLRERPPRLVLAGAAVACAGVVILAL